MFDVHGGAARGGQDPPRVLVGTLYCGESQFSACRASVEAQRYPRRDHVVLRDLPNKEAHRALYRTFMEEASEYEIFVKLDADMAFTRPDALELIVELFREKEELDHALLAVHDWASGLLIMGLHAFSHRARWPETSERLFVDTTPEIPGRKLVTRKAPAPLAVHGADPEPFEAFHFGVHRALKVVQRERERFKYHKARSQWRLLQAVWRRFQATDRRELGLIVLGADRVFAGKLKRDHYDLTGPTLRRHFEDRYADRSSRWLRDTLHERWGHPARRALWLRRAVGPGRYYAAAFKQVPRRLVGDFLLRFSSDVYLD